MTTDTADALSVLLALQALTTAGKVAKRAVRDTIQFAATGATEAEVLAAFHSEGFPAAQAMTDALMDPHRIAVYSREEVSFIPGLFWDTQLGKRSETVETLTKRGLTSAETTAATQVFGSSLNYDDIVLEEAPVMSLGGYARTTPWTINFPSGTLAGGLSNTWLIHEMGHSWQYARGVSMATTAYHAVRGIYAYGGEARLQEVTAAGRGLGAFNTEQQADIAKDVYLNLGSPPATRAIYQPYLAEFQSGSYL